MSGGIGNLVTNSSPRLTGRGGGVATIFRSSLKCQSLLMAHFRSFEVQLIKLGMENTFACALIYRPPHYNKMFIQEFSEFLNSLVPVDDKLLIVGDFNIHVCCPSHSLVSEFLQIIDSFNLVLSKSNPTHEKGHFTLSHFIWYFSDLLTN